MKKFHELPKDILVQLLVNVNNLSSLTYEQLEERERRIAIEKKRRDNSKKCEVIKYSLLQLKFFPHLKRFIEENTDTINSIEMVAVEEYYPKIRIKGIDYPIIYGQFSPFLKALSNLCIKPDWNSLLNEISKYIGGDGYGGDWLTATQIDYNLCVICNKKQVLFQYDNIKSICLGIAADDTVYYSRECIVTCSTCGKIHCIDHDCEPLSRL